MVKNIFEPNYYRYLVTVGGETQEFTDLEDALRNAMARSADWVKAGAVVVDAGYHPGGVGDVELSALLDKVSAYTPVPGGVGPMTIAMLLENTWECMQRRLEVHGG